MIGTLLSLLTTGCDSANTIEGKVVDTWGNPIEGATVMIVGGNERPMTDASGRYRLAAVAGEFEMKAGSKGYVQDHRKLVVAKGSRRTEGPVFELYPKPDGPGMYLVGTQNYIPLEPRGVRTVGNALEQFRGIPDHGGSSTNARPARILYHTDLREDALLALNLRLRKLRYVEDTELPGPLGTTSVRVGLWVDGGDVPIELVPLNSKTDYLIPLPKDLPAGVYAFEMQGLLSGRPEQVATVPDELRVIFPFQTE
jgi:Carboxypeptidase regulatory-like domain